jgi:hypothetical protein
MYVVSLTALNSWHLCFHSQICKHMMQFGFASVLFRSCNKHFIGHDSSVSNCLQTEWPQFKYQQGLDFSLPDHQAPYWIGPMGKVARLWNWLLTKVKNLYSFTSISPIYIHNMVLRCRDSFKFYIINSAFIMLRDMSVWHCIKCKDMKTAM